jgi:hypothetical protein
VPRNVRFLGKRGAIESFGVRQLTLTMMEQPSLNVRIHEDFMKILSAVLCVA